MGYPPPCQPPLVTTESPSPSNLPKKTFWIVDFLFPRNLLLSSRVLLSIDRSLRFAVGLSFRSLGFLLLWPWRSVSTSFRRRGGAVSVRESVSRWLPKLLLGPVSQWLWHRDASAVPFVVAKVVPKNCYRYSSRRFCIGLVPHNRGCALPVHVHLRSRGDFLPKLPIFLWMGELLVPRDQIFLPISLTLSPEFVTNTLLGLSRPVGKGPGGPPRKSSTTPWGAALFPCGEEANKLYAFFGPFPPEMRGCEQYFHCFQWRFCAINNIIFAKI